VHDLIRLADASPRRRYTRLTPALAAAVVRQRALKRSYRQIAADLRLSHGTVAKAVTAQANVPQILDLAKRCGLDRAAIRARGTDLLVTRLGTMIDGVMDLLEGTIRAGDAKGFAAAAQGVERLQRMLGRGRVAPAATPTLDFAALARQIIDRSAAASPLSKVS
jgi:hypothetical protein